MASERGEYNVGAYLAYPDCEPIMRQLRWQEALESPHDTDCDYQLLARRINASICPPLPKYFEPVTMAPSSGLVEVASSAPAVHLLALPSTPACTPQPTAVEALLSQFGCTPGVPGVPRLRRIPGTFYLLLDCSPWLMRAISYSPVPFGQDPSYTIPYGDYFTDQYAPLFERDLKYIYALSLSLSLSCSFSRSLPLTRSHSLSLPLGFSMLLALPPLYIHIYGSAPSPSDESQLYLLVRSLFKDMGANTVRLYAWRQSARHGAFLDSAHSRGLVVIAVYEMGTAEDTPVGTVQERALLRARVQSRLAISRHPAIVAWLIGNELNGEWNEFVCSDYYAETYLHQYCTFRDSAVQLCQLVDSLCQLVTNEGLLCSTPLAGVSPPSRYNWGRHPYGMHGWVQVCEGSKPSPGEEWFRGVQHIDFWAGNLYPGRNFDAFNFTSFGEVSKLPLMISEFGVGARGICPTALLNSGAIPTHATCITFVHICPATLQMHGTPTAAAVYRTQSVSAARTRRCRRSGYSRLLRILSDTLQLAPLAVRLRLGV